MPAAGRQRMIVACATLTFSTSWTVGTGHRRLRMGWVVGHGTAIRPPDAGSKQPAGKASSPFPDSMRARPGMKRPPGTLSARRARSRCSNPHMLRPGGTRQSASLEHLSGPSSIGHRRVPAAAGLMGGGGCPIAATYDSTTQRLYVLANSGTNYYSYILVYEVGNANAPGQRRGAVRTDHDRPGHPRRHRDQGQHLRVDPGIDAGRHEPARSQVDIQRGRRGQCDLLNVKVSHQQQRGR